MRTVISLRRRGFQICGTNAYMDMTTNAVIKTFYFEKIDKEIDRRHVKSSSESSGTPSPRSSWSSQGSERTGLGDESVYSAKSHQSAETASNKSNVSEVSESSSSSAFIPMIDLSTGGLRLPSFAPRPSAAVIAAAWWFYPVWTGLPIPYNQWQMRMWMPTWI